VASAFSVAKRASISDSGLRSARIRRRRSRTPFCHWLAQELAAATQEPPLKQQLETLQRIIEQDTEPDPWRRRDQAARPARRRERTADFDPRPGDAPRAQEQGAGYLGLRKSLFDLRRHAAVANLHTARGITRRAA
jgi:hypothetical protein